jgi:2-polyprenyl-3-methyl-5-hydroxy-6-metoxy-1,4-benzoquinol methylase
MSLRSSASLAYNLLARAVLTPQLKREWSRGLASRTERLVGYADALRWIVDRSPDTLLDVGPGPSSWPNLIAFGGVRVTAIDNMQSPWHGRWLNQQRYFNRHFYVIRDDISHPRLTQTFDFVTCLGVMELVDDFDAAVRGLFHFVRSGGYVAMTCPYNERQFVPNAYALPEAGYGQDLPYVCRQYSRADLERWTAANDAEIEGMNLYQCFTGEFWTMGERLAPVVKATPDARHHLALILFRKR